MALRTSAIDGSSDVISRVTWLLPGNLTKMLLIDRAHNDNDFPLAISVLNFTTELLETGLEDDIILALVTLSIQYVLVNHEYWKYKVKQVHWRITLKVLEVMKKCIMKTSSYSHKLFEAIQYILLSDTSIHNTLFKIICTAGQTLEKLYVSRLLDVVDIQGAEVATCSVLDILFIMLCKFSKDISPGLPVFHQVMLSSMTKRIPVVAAVLSLMSYFRNPPAFLVSIFTTENMDVYQNNSTNLDQPKSEPSPELLGPEKSSLLTVALHYVERSSDFFNSNPRVLLNVLNFLKALWQGTSQYAKILKSLKRCKDFWKRLSECTTFMASMEPPTIEAVRNEGFCFGIQVPVHFCGTGDNGA